MCTLLCLRSTILHHVALIKSFSTTRTKGSPLLSFLLQQLKAKTLLFSLISLAKTILVQLISFSLCTFSCFHKAMKSRPLHIAMYPWLAMGHQTAFLHLCNKLAIRGHKISFITPPKAQAKLEPFNLHPNSITFVTINVPHVEGLPPDAQTTADVTYPLQPQIMTAMDLTKDDIETLLTGLKPDLVFYDFTHWMPALAKRLGIKAVHYCTASSVMVGYTLTPSRFHQGTDLMESDLMEPPEGYLTKYRYFNLLCVSIYPYPICM